MIPKYNTLIFVGLLILPVLLAFTAVTAKIVARFLMGSLACLKYHDVVCDGRYLLI